MNHPDPTATVTRESPETDTVEGERSIPSVNRIRSMQSRVTGLLAAGFVAILGAGALTWYYVHEWKQSQAGRDRAANTTQQRAQGEMKLPPLGRVTPPQFKPTESPEPLKSVWGTAPPVPPASLNGPATPLTYRATPANTAGNASPPIDRRLTGPVLSYEEASTTSAPLTTPSSSPASSVRPPGISLPPSLAALAPTQPSAPGMASMLQPTSTPAALAQVLPTQRLLLPKGAFIDCTLETAIDSSLQGLVTCVTPADIFSVDGTTVLLERGTKLVGETRGEARQGLARVHVLWSEARTPTGVVARLDSPGTDELGRAGLPGRVERHFFERFGAALLVTVIEGAIQRAAQPSDGGTVILNPSATGTIATEALKSTVHIPPTILKQNGERIQILVARDVDFRSVYELRPAAAR